MRQTHCANWLHVPAGLGFRQPVQNRRTHRCAGLLSFFPLSEMATARSPSPLAGFSSMLVRSGAHGRVEAAALIVERSVDLVLVFDKDVVTRHRLARWPRKGITDGRILLQVAAAVPTSRVVSISRAVIHRSLRIGAQRTRQGRG